jgi:predicted HAD superfamily Cof-like phosphohydrolase
MRKGLNYAFDQVKEFHTAFNHPVSYKPVAMTSERAAARAAWMQEEINEFLDSDNVVDQADAMIDLIYFALGTLVEMGVQPQPLMDIVQKANMSKLWDDGKPHYREDGKIIKPEGWEDPYPKLKAEIERQIEQWEVDIA